jgi:hypothetical protein
VTSLHKGALNKHLQQHSDRFVALASSDEPEAQRSEAALACAHGHFFSLSSSVSLL